MTAHEDDYGPDEVYEGTVYGNRLTLRRTPDNVCEWESFSSVYYDHEVTNLVRLVPVGDVHARILRQANEIRELKERLEDAEARTAAHVLGQEAGDE